MRYLKSVLVGMVAAVIAAIAWIFVALILPGLLTFTMSHFAGAGSGGIGADFVSSGSVLLVALIVFAVVFLWMLRRPAAVQPIPPKA